MISASGVILAAGCGKRMGLPKALLDSHGQPLALAQARFIQEHGCAQSCIVIGCQAERVGAALQDWPQVTLNHQWESGQFSSLLRGLNEVPPDRWALVLPVDVIGLRTETLSALLHTDETDCDAIQPVFQGRKGHPVLLSPNYVRHLLTLDPLTNRLDHQLHQARVRLVDVPDPAVRSNCNRPEDLDKP